MDVERQSGQQADSQADQQGAGQAEQQGAGQADRARQIDKEQVVDLLRARGQHDRAQQIDCALPRRVDVEADAGLLHAVEVNLSDLPLSGARVSDAGA
jgi:hypothetical protein